MIRLDLDYPVSSNRYWATRVFYPKDSDRPLVQTYVTPAARAYKEQVKWRAKAAGILAPFEGRIHIAFSLHPRLPQDWRLRSRKDPDCWDDTVQCMDLDNAQKVLIDSMKGVVFEDDKFVWKITAQRGEPKPESGVVVFVAPVQAQLVQSTLELTA